MTVKLTETFLSVRYPSDLTDAEWSLIEGFVPAPRLGPDPRKYTPREIVNALRYKLRTGCQWEYLPHDLPPWKSVSDYFYSDYFYLWRDDGTWERLNAALRKQVRQAAGRAADPSLGIIDSQSVKGTESGGEIGFDAGKRVKGRKRHAVVDILGLLLVVLVTAASVSDQAMIQPLPAQDRREHRRRTATGGPKGLRTDSDSVARGAVLRVDESLARVVEGIHPKYTQ